MSKNNNLPNNGLFNSNKPMPPGWEKEIQKRNLKKASKQIKTNRDSRPRQKNWLDRNEESLEDGGFERIMPRGERERRMKVIERARQIVAEQEAAANAVETEEIVGLRGVVIEVSTGMCRVDVDGRILLCGLRGSLSAEATGFTNVVAVGDNVVITETASDQGIVDRVLPRKSVLARASVGNGHLRHLIVANAEQLLIVASWREPHLWPELVDRYLITAERDALQPILCVNKIDLAADRDEVEDVLQPYTDLDIDIVLTSTRTGEGIDALRTMLTNRSTVLAGLSGVGKSSLISAVQPGLNLKVSEVSDFDSQGRHTTTQALLARLAGGGVVIDTPGIREFGLSGLQRAELASFFPEIDELASECRFSNCTHNHEPGCAVRSAVRAKVITESRYHSYQRIYESLG